MTKRNKPQKLNMACHHLNLTDYHKDPEFFYKNLGIDNWSRIWEKYLGIFFAGQFQTKFLFQQKVIFCWLFSILLAPTYCDFNFTQDWVELKIKLPCFFVSMLRYKLIWSVKCLGRSHIKKMKINLAKLYLNYPFFLKSVKYYKCPNKKIQYV